MYIYVVAVWACPFVLFFLLSGFIYYVIAESSLLLLLLLTRSSAKVDPAPSGRYYFSIAKFSKCQFACSRSRFPVEEGNRFSRSLVICILGSRLYIVASSILYSHSQHPLLLPPNYFLFFFIIFFFRVDT